MNRKYILAILILIQSLDAVRINFTTCQNPEWSCTNNLPAEIVYTCSLVPSNDFIIHLKDYYTDHITSVTVQNCRDLRVVLDCPILQRASQLQRFKIKDCDKVEFISLSSSSLLQTPPEVFIENVREIVSLPRGIFKSPVTNTELKCLGANTLKKVRVTNSKINTINARAIFNVTGIKSIEFANVTMANVESLAIEAMMGNDNTLFSMSNCNVQNLGVKGISVKSKLTIIDNNTFNDLLENVINVTSDYLQFTKNTIKTVYANGLLLKSVNSEISNNKINFLKLNALSGIKCVRKRTNRKYFNLSKNTIRNLEPYSLEFDYASCKAAGTTVNVSKNKIDCKCRNISYLSTSRVNTEFHNLILEVANNNTCALAPCALPVEVVKLLLESNMCQLNLDPQIMCLLYNDRKNSSNNDVTTDEDVTEPAPTFYLIRQANSPNGGASAALTAIDKDGLLKDSNLNMTNRTAIKVVFDSSRDFVETLRSTGTHRRPVEDPKPTVKEEYVNRCVGSHCRDNAYDKQKALDFYKYVYAQLRPPRVNDNKKKKT